MNEPRTWKMGVVWIGLDDSVHYTSIIRYGTREEALDSARHTMNMDPGVKSWDFNLP